MTHAEAIVRDYRLELENSKKLLEAVPEAHFAWKPHEKSMSLAALAGHIAEAPSWISSMGEDTFEMNDMEGYEPYVPETADELLATFERNARLPIDFLEGRDDDFLTAEWTMTAGGHEVMRSPRDAAIRSILLHHVAHHRGQLTVYLRLLGLAVPPTYGPTADSGESFG